MVTKIPDSFVWKFTEDNEKDIHRIEVQDTYTKVTDKEFEAIVKKLREAKRPPTVNGRTITVTIDVPKDTMLSYMLQYALANMIPQMSKNELIAKIDAMIKHHRKLMGMK